MTREFNKRGELFPNLSDNLTCQDVRELAGISEKELRRWINKGLLTPERFIRGQPRIFFGHVQLARAAWIKKLRTENWGFPEIKEELCTDYLSRNMDEIQKIILENQRADETS